MKRFRIALLTLLFAPLNLLADGKDEIRIITMNQYIGTSLADIAQGSDSGAIYAAIQDALENIGRTRTDVRLTTQAATIASRRPHIVGLQEVLTVTCEGMCTGVPTIDHLGLTLGALNRHDRNYKIAGSVANFDIKVPIWFSNNKQAPPDLILSITDRDIILVQQDISTTVVEFACFENENVDLAYSKGCNYKNSYRGIKRGYVGVDVTINGDHYRVVNTHLEIKNAIDNEGSVQSRQAEELLDAIHGSTDADTRLLLIGDFNSSPSDTIPSPISQLTPQTPYQILSESLTDIWQLRPGNPKGYTCCQAPLLDNEHSQHSRRIDMIFAYPEPKRVKANVIDNYIEDPTQMLPPYWSSDHSSVLGRLYYKGRKSKR